MDFEEAHRAIKKGDLSALRQAIPSSLSPNVSNRFGWTLLMLTAIKGNTAIGEFLIAAGADVNAQNDFAESAITLAVCEGHIRFIQLLKQSGAIISGLRPHGHELPIWLRSSSGLPEDKVAAILATLNDETEKFAAGERGR
jgi:ankyrin repeat protein